MQYKCSACEDTGNLSKHLAGNLDCTSCSAATDRVELEKWLDKNTAIGDQDSAWLIHQRALAMAPKHEPRLVAQIVNNERDNEGNYINCHIISTGDHDLEHLAHGMKLYDAAPAAANGAPASNSGSKNSSSCALTDEKAMEIVWEFQAGGDDGKFTFLAADLPGMFRAILAAAGPDAALINERESFEAVERASELVRDSDGNYENPCVQSAWEGWQNRAALSGAKGN